MYKLMSGAKNCRTFGTLVIGMALSLVSTVIYAGEYHAPKEKTYLGTTETLVCSQCHTMHGSQGGQSLIYGGASTVNKALLRASSIVQLCRTCHENNSLGMSNPTPPDIWTNTLGYTASAGDFADRNVVNEANRHSVDSSNLTPPGSNPTINISYFSCINCHDQHGNNNYRNLKKRPGNASSDITINFKRTAGGPATCSDGTASPCDVEYNADSGQGATTNLYKYNRDNVKFLKAATATRGIAPFCGGCHTDFHGAGGASNIGGAVGGDTGNSPWLRHPVRDVSINQGEADKHADRSNWAGLSIRTRTINPDNTDPTSSDADEQPFCLSCHYAHGGGNPNNATDPTLDHTNLVFFDSSATPKINIDSAYVASTGRIRNLCQQCHNQ